VTPWNGCPGSRNTGKTPDDSQRIPRILRQTEIDEREVREEGRLDLHAFSAIARNADNPAPGAGTPAGHLPFDGELVFLLD
jgi:hypothetical protein